MAHAAAGAHQPRVLRRGAHTGAALRALPERETKQLKEGSARVLLSALASTRRPRDNFAHLRADDMLALGASTLLTLRPGQCARILHPKDLSWAALSACVAAGTLSLLTMLLAACATGGGGPSLPPGVKFVKMGDGAYAIQDEGHTFYSHTRTTQLVLLVSALRCLCVHIAHAPTRDSVTLVE